MKKIYIIVCIVFFSLYITGCGKKEEIIINTEESAQFDDNEVDILDIPWELNSDDDIRKSSGWIISSYLPVFNEEEEESIWDLKTTSDNDYLFYLFSVERADTISHDEESHLYDYYIRRVDTKTLTVESIRIDIERQDYSAIETNIAPEQISRELRERYITPISIDVNDGMIDIFFAEYSDEKIVSFIMIEMNTDGIISHIYDYPQLVSYAGNEKARCISGEVGGIEDEIYLYDNLNGIVYGINRNNRDEIVQVDIPEYIKSATLMYSGKSINNVPVFSAEIKGGKKIYFSVKGNKADIKSEGMLDGNTSIIDRYGDLIYLFGSELIIWNIADGKQEQIYSFTGMDGFQCHDIIRNQDGSVTVAYGSKGEHCIYKIENDPGAEVKKIEILVGGLDYYISDCAAEYTRKHPGIVISTEKIQDRGGLEWNILLEDIKAGVGPDIIQLNRRQLDTLVDAKVVSPLDEVLSEDIKNNIFEGAYRFGEYDCKHYAIPYEAYLFVFGINNGYWSKDSWSLSEMMDTFDAVKKENPNISRVEAIYYDADYTQLLYDLCLINIEDCEFVDFESGKCDFQNENFYRLLRFCKENSENPVNDYYTEDEMISQVQNGTAFMMSILGGLNDYSRIKSKLGENYSDLGTPSATGVIANIEVYWGAALSSYSENAEIASDFINYMLDKDNQLKYTTDYVRRDVIRDNIIEHSDMSKDPLLKLGKNSYIPLAGREDGSSYADEYITLMDNATPISDKISILDIIMEESGAFFSGAKNEYDTAKIIQSRVQLYLDETKH